MTRFVALTFGFLVLFVCFVQADDPQTTTSDDVPKANISPKKIADQPMSVWMEKKLEYSQAIFKGLALGDMDNVTLNARRMNLVGKVEGFARKKNRPYQTQLHTFDAVSHEIMKQAAKGNIEGATLAFNQLTVNCVQCHKLLRAETPKK